MALLLVFAGAQRPLSKSEEIAPFGHSKEEKKYLPLVQEKIKNAGGGGLRLSFYDQGAKLPDWNPQPPVWPIELNQRFGRYHTGIDLQCNYREPVYAVQDGVVVFTGWLSGYGKTVKIAHPGGFTTLYAHLDEIFVRERENARMGLVVGSCGTTGRSSGHHVHWEIIKDNQWLNPWPYLQDVDK